MAAEHFGDGVYVGGVDLGDVLHHAEAGDAGADQREVAGRGVARLGGIYGLERIADARIAKTSEQDQRTVVEVLSAFIREHSRPTTSRMLLPIERSRMQTAEPPPARARQDRAATPKPATDVQAAVTVLGRLPSRDGVPRGDLTGAVLGGAGLDGADLTRADLIGANLAGAYLIGANLTRARLDRADLTGTYLGGADLTGARLDGADLTGARLGGADLTGARLDGADLTGTYLGGATLTDIRNLTSEQLYSARGDDQTKLPTGWQPPGYWATGPAAPPAADQ